MIDLKKAILERTNGGRDIFIQLYPEARDIFYNHDGKGKIRLRDERTPSASFRLTKDKNGNDCWMLKDFGADTDWSCFDAYMHEKGFAYFGQAVRQLAEELNIDFSISADLNKVKISSRPATPEEVPGTYLGERREPNENELRVIGPTVTAEIMKRFNYSILTSYTIIKYSEKRKCVMATTFETTDTYPIFIHDCVYESENKDGGKIQKTFSKIYKPLDTEKANRFFYVGEKPRDFMNGYLEAKEYIEKVVEFCTHQDKNGFNVVDYKQAGEMGVSANKKLKQIVICSGERDALSLAGLGYFPIWFNSETAKVNSDTIGLLYRIAEIVYNIPDKDETGVRQGAKLALEHIDIRMIELPNWLSKFHDARKSPCKDFRDYVDILGAAGAKKDFGTLINSALCARFWEYTSGDKSKIEIHAMNLLFFLRLNGFYKYQDEITKEIFPIRVQGYTVEKYEPVQIRDFVREQLRRMQVPAAVLEAYINSKRASKQIYDDLDTITIDFQYSDAYGRTMFFENTIARITRITETTDGVELFNTPKNGKYVWKEKINPHKFTRLKPSFIYDFEHGDLQLHLENNPSNVMKFIVNTSRTQWKTEWEKVWEDMAVYPNEEETQYKATHQFCLDGDKLAPEQILEQKLNMTSKIYTIGYLMSQYKVDSCAKAVWAMENRITREDESSGRSGKSLLFKCFAKLHLAEMVTLDGRNKKTTDNAHFMDRVSNSTDILLIDDAGKGFDFYTYYKMITGSIEVNPKNEKSFEIAYEDAPNIAFTSNFPLPNRDNSTLDRILFLSFSDWYHAKGLKGEYKESRSIRDDIGKDLFGFNYSEDEYNQDINFFIDCLQFYLTCRHYNIPPIQPPIENILKRQLLEEMGTPFFSWAREYFATGCGKTDVCIVKQAAYDDYCRTINDKKFQKSVQSFKAALQDFVEYYDEIYECLNPEGHPFYRKDERLRNGRLTSSCVYNGATKSWELLYIQTKGSKEFNKSIVQ